MRPSKLRLPLSTDTTTRLSASTSAATSSGSGPLLPMQVVQPYPTRLKPSCSRYGVRPALFRYSVTTFEPGAGLVFTHGWLDRPRSTARFASSPAPIITLGFDVFVQLVIAAITTEPWSTRCAAGATAGPSATATDPSLIIAAAARITDGGSAAFFAADCMLPSAVWNPLFACLSDTRSCGRLGPARLGSMAPRSSSMTSEYTGSASAAVRKIPCAFAYASTS